LKIGLIFGAIAGLAVGICLVFYQGLDDVSDALLKAGWQGFAAVTVAHLVAIAFCALAWRVLATTAPPGSYLAFYWARFLRDAVNNLIGIFPCAGEVAGARELTWRGVPVGEASATTVVDVTTELASQLVFALIGVAVLVYVQPGAHSNWLVGCGIAVASIVLVGFIVAQRNGLFRFLETLPCRLGLSLPSDQEKGSTSVHAEIQAIYRQRYRVGASIAWHFVAWIARSLEAIAALYIMDQSISILKIVALEALVYALRTVSFVVPSAIGVQEASYVLIGGIFGLDPEVALAISLLKRAREVALGLPALIGWQLLETQRLLRGLTVTTYARETDTI
jgi:putative membrane protein